MFCIRLRHTHKSQSAATLVIIPGRFITADPAAATGRPAGWSSCVREGA